MVIFTVTGKSAQTLPVLEWGYLQCPEEVIQLAVGFVWIDQCRAHLDTKLLAELLAQAVNGNPYRTGGHPELGGDAFIRRAVGITPNKCAEANKEIRASIRRKLRADRAQHPIDHLQRPRAIECLFRGQTGIDRFILKSLVGAFRIQREKREIASPLPGPRLLPIVGKKAAHAGDQIPAKTAALRHRAAETIRVEQQPEKFLRQIFRGTVITAAPAHIRVEGKPVGSAQLFECDLRAGAAMSGRHNHRPMGGRKVCPITACVLVGSNVLLSPLSDGGYRTRMFVGLAGGVHPPMLEA